MRCSRGEMYIGHGRLCLSVATFSHYCMDLDVSWGMVEVPSSCALLADLQSLHRFHCYDNIGRMQNVSECLYSLYAWLI